MRREVIRATAWGILATGVLGALIVIGSRRLAHFDAVLVGYTFAVLFATFGITYRYAMWLQRPPTAVYWRRGWQVFLSPGHRGRMALYALRRVADDIALNRFIWRRGKLRGAGHWLIMWGCILAVAITFPLVFGWLHFESAPEDLERYRVFVFGFQTFSFHVGSSLGLVLFHGLVWASFLVIAGIMIVMRRRMRDEGAAAVQRFVEDFLPLVLLFAVSLSGLLLTASYTWMKGYGYDFLGTLHAIMVIATLLWLPFGKLFHVFQRPAQLGAALYKEAGRLSEPARCRRCGHAFSSRMHIEDLISTERDLGYRYETPANAIEHYQWICPPCRRAMLALAQESLWRAAHGRQPLGVATPDSTLPMPVFVHPEFAPLGAEDRSNFHP